MIRKSLRVTWLRASILIHMLLLFLLVTLLITGAFLVIQYYFLPAQQIRQHTELSRALHEYTDWALAQHTSLVEAEEWLPAGQALFRGPQVVYRKFRHGVYQGYALRAYTPRDTLQKAFLLGYETDRSLALLIPENNRMLRYSGQAEVAGDAALSSKGIKKAYIEGKSPLNRQLVTGGMREVQNTFPTELLKWMAERGLPQTAPPDIRPLGAGDSIHVSFAEPGLLLQCETSVLQDVFLSGNVRVVSSGPLTIGMGCVLSQVVVEAPSIRLEPGVVTAGLQCLASDSITCASGVQLTYPTVLMVQSTGSSGQIRLEPGARVSGDVIFYQSRSNQKRNHPAILVEPEAEIEGSIFTNTTLDLRGRVDGRVTCSGFLLITPSAVYENHILDGRILPGERSRHWVSALPYSTQNAIVQWAN